METINHLGNFLNSPIPFSLNFSFLPSKLHLLFLRVWPSHLHIPALDEEPLCHDPGHAWRSVEYGLIKYHQYQNAYSGFLAPFPIQAS